MATKEQKKIEFTHDEAWEILSHLAYTLLNDEYKNNTESKVLDSVLVSTLTAAAKQLDKKYGVKFGPNPYHIDSVAADHAKILASLVKILTYQYQQLRLMDKAKGETISKEDKKSYVTGIKNALQMDSLFAFVTNEDNISSTILKGHDKSKDLINTVVKYLSISSESIKTLGGPKKAAIKKIVGLTKGHFAKEKTLEKILSTYNSSYWTNSITKDDQKNISIKISAQLTKLGLMGGIEKNQTTLIPTLFSDTTPSKKKVTTN